MSNSVVFLLIAVGLSALGSIIVWLHGRPRRTRSSVDHFKIGLQALSANGGRHEAQSGVVLRREVVVDDVEAEPEIEEEEAPAARSQRPSPRPSPRPTARPRSEPNAREETRPGA